MNPAAFNENISASCSELGLFKGEMTLLPHQGQAISGSGSISLLCGGAHRHLRTVFQPANNADRCSLPGSKDGRFGAGTAFAQIPGFEPFFVFVTSGAGSRVIGESQWIEGGSDVPCDSFEVYLNNMLLPGMTRSRWELPNWEIVAEQTPCAYDLTRHSMPTQEINLPHRLLVRRPDGTKGTWTDAEPSLTAFLSFLNFANDAETHAAVAYGKADNRLRSFLFRVPGRSIPENRRSWATQIPEDDLQDAFRCFLRTLTNPFWANVMQRSVHWKGLAVLSRLDSSAQALLTVQMLLEMWSYAVLVEDAGILGEDGYGKLPAADRITLLCGSSNQAVGLPKLDHDMQIFCSSNSIKNIGELIAGIRNKFVHPTKKNRDYLSKVPRGLEAVALTAGLQIASLTALRVMGYRGKYFNTLEHQVVPVPWAAPAQSA